MKAETNKLFLNLDPEFIELFDEWKYLVKQKRLFYKDRIQDLIRKDIEDLKSYISFEDNSSVIK